MISIVIPAFNTEGYIADCLSSVERQDCADYEVLVVDDGSTDGTWDAIQDARRSNDRIVAFRQANLGVSAARNVGLEHASGEHVLFVDSDDLLADGALAILLETVAAHPRAEIVFFSARTLVEGGVREPEAVARQYARARTPGLGELPGPRFLLAALDMGEAYVASYVQLVRRELIERSNTRFPEGIIHEDEYFSTLLCASARSVVAVPDSLYIRRYRPGSIMSNAKSEQNFLGYLGSATLLAGRYADFGSDASAQAALGRKVNALTSACLDNYLNNATFAEPLRKRWRARAQEALAPGRRVLSRRNLLRLYHPRTSRVVASLRRLRPRAGVAAGQPGSRPG